jgi:hypothetical protein
MQETLDPERRATPPPNSERPAAPPPSSRASRVAARGAGSVLLALAALVAVGGVTFAVGRLTAPAAAATTRGSGNGAGSGAFPGGQGFGRQGGPAGFAGAGGLTIRGTVTETTPSGITVRLANGTTITIPTDGSTTYHRQAAASSGDVASGSQVLVELGGGQGAAGQGPNASPSPGASPRLGPARDVTIVAP